MWTNKMKPFASLNDSSLSCHCNVKQGIFRPKENVKGIFSPIDGRRTF